MKGSGGENNEEEENANDFVVNKVEEVRNVLNELPSYTVKELKELLSLYGDENNKHEYFIEKEDMRKTLSEILLSSLSPEERIVLNEDMRNDSSTTTEKHEKTL